MLLNYARYLAISLYCTEKLVCLPADFIIIIYITILWYLLCYIILYNIITIDTDNIILYYNH